jgi:hypothetical protein
MPKVCVVKKEIKDARGGAAPIRAQHDYVAGFACLVILLLYLSISFISLYLLYLSISFIFLIAAYIGGRDHHLLQPPTTARFGRHATYYQGHEPEKNFSFRRVLRFRSEHSPPYSLSTALYDNMIK